MAGTFLFHCPFIYCVVIRLATSMTSSTEYFIVGPFFPLSFLEPLIFHKADLGKERPSVIGIRPLFGGCEVYKAEYPTGRKAENLIVFFRQAESKAIFGSPHYDAYASYHML